MIKWFASNEAGAERGVEPNLIRAKLKAEFAVIYKLKGGVVSYFKDDEIEPFLVQANIGFNFKDITKHEKAMV